ncbi:uncharacterized protein KIAA1755 homolog isoform X2 [Eucyclogobius newberryi]|uniref:uncharacterized protein KIAA1755 homolog isoform X2 n=1 Tax=Eucyclogobius newberryi TaxID=166745 RepID=UPI003B5A507B
MPDCVEGSIQALLSDLYPPFESTAPTVLSQLFTLIQDRYGGDALRCLLHFLVPAKHILDSVQQAACSQYPDRLFLHGGWPLCLRDQVVIHLSPINPLHLRPRDFYLQVAPFCDRSARILVCSRLEEAGLGQEDILIEETPIPETSYPCIFTVDWLTALNQDRNGTPLSHCLLANEQGVVRLPWERVALPEFFNNSQNRNIMASAPSSYPPIPPPLPNFPETSALSKQLSLSKPVQQPAASQNYSVETRIRPAKHGIAVSLRLVDTSVPSSVANQASVIKESEQEAKPVVWVLPSARGNQEKEGKTKSVMSKELDIVSNNKESVDRVNVTEGEYIDITQATMLFGKAHLSNEQEDTRHFSNMQKLPITQQRPMDSYKQTQRQLTTFTSAKLPPRPHNCSPPTLNMSPANPVAAPNVNPHSSLESPETPPCFRSGQFSEKPCTPCLQRKNIGRVSKAQELRCKYRDSYQAAIQNPLNDKPKIAMCTVVEEESDLQQNISNSTQNEPGNPWGTFHGHLMQAQSNAICKESGESNAISYWKAGDSAPVVEYRGTEAPKHEADRTTVALRQPRTNMSQLPPRIPNEGCCNSPTQAHFGYCSNENQGTNYVEQNRDNFFRNLSFYSPQSRRGSVQSNGRGSSLSTAVVDTSEKCDVVIVDGQKVRRKENREPSPDVPQLHVVKCKNSTAFGLVSPKICRRKLTIPGPLAAGSAQSGPSSSFHTVVQSKPPPALVKRSPPSLTARPRPDHLPLGSTHTRSPLLQGVTALTGGRDKCGRAIIEVYGEHPGWRGAVISQELFKVLLYFYSITRREIREAGLTVIFDARKSSPQPQLYKALMSLEELCPRSVHSLVLLVDKENKQSPERCPGIQTEILTSMKSLLKLVEGGQLSPLLSGTLAPGRCDWTALHQKLFPFVCDLHEALELLLRAISKLQEPKRTDSVQSVQQCMVDQRTLMRDVLEDGRLVSLQREGGAMLARLRKESELRYPQCDELSDAVDSVGSLYNQLEEQVHVLVQRSNLSLEHLQYLLQLRDMQGHLNQMQQWFDEEGERHLLEAQSVDNSGEHMEQILNSFTAFLIEANDRRHHAMTLVSEAERLQQSGTSYPQTEAFRVLVEHFKCGLEDFLCRAEACGRELQTMVHVCDFCEQATALANECVDYLDRSHSRTPTNEAPTQDRPAVSDELTQSSSGTAPPPPPAADSELSTLHSLLDRLDQFSPERFQEVKLQAGTLRASRGMRVWNVAWLRCHEARQQLEERILERTQARESSHYIDVVSTEAPLVGPGGQALVVQSTPGPGHPQWDGMMSGVLELGDRRFEESSYGPGTVRTEEQAMERADVPPQSPRRSVKKSDRESRRRQAARARSERDTAALSQAHNVGCQWFPWSRGLGLGRSVSEDSCSTGGSTGGTASSPSCRILQEAQRYQLSRHGSFSSDESCLSQRGAAGMTRGSSSLPISTYEPGLCAADSSSHSLRLQRVLEELLYTEREYVRSLGYILTHYLPLLDRPDVPQDLRGKRAIIFGNLEKLFDFHSHYFLPELEACQGEPALVARCFLRYSESFGLYALYSKNKPKSDVLILHRRHDIFKKKQQELGDHMDLSSYLLRPIQRISKYSLLLQDMLSLVGSSLCGPSVYVPEYTRAERERERADIQAAADLVRFQMRHGNDLLTMDAIRDCDVNLKEQGQLIRQDEFTVTFRKKKCVRRVFLFEELILFSKTKKTDVGNDVYVYKQSFKTSDIGMTHNSSLSGLCFEIWFRRRKSEDTYTLRAASVEVKRAWTLDLERILWNQANHSREMRLQERVFMGIGHKPFLDIQPSDAAICDRAVNCALPGRIPVACCSHRALVPRPNSIGSGSTASTTLSQSSSSSGRGSLPPAGYRGSSCPGAEPGVGGLGCSTPEAVAENELNNLHLHQHLRQRRESWRAPLLDSTESSGDCAPVFSSDQSCLSALGAEVVDSSSSFLSRRGSLCRTPILRTPSSPALSRRGAAQVHKSQSLPCVQGDKSVIGKSTEV